MPDEPVSMEGFLRRAADICDGFEDLRQHAQRLSAVAGTVNQPFTLAIVGRMKTGKSTLLNSLVGSPLALSDVEEATATINWIRYGAGEQTSRMIVHWRDSRNEIMPRGRVLEWSGKSPEVLERVRQTSWLEFFADLPVLKHLQFVDTPGTGSAVSVHDDTASQFLDEAAITNSVAEGRKADAIVYVISSVGRESDADILDDFKDGRLPGSDPYNSVCVFHRWDGLDPGSPGGSPYEEACRKALTLRGQLGDTVADVLCVSAPLALAGRAAPDQFFQVVIDAAGSVATADLDRLLNLSDRWDRDPARKQARQLYPFPWVCFRNLVRLCASHPGMTAASLRQECLRRSHIEDLEKFLEERFFTRAGIIKQSQTLRKAQDEIEPAILKLRQRRETSERSARLCRELLDSPDRLTAAQREWLTDLSGTTSGDRSRTDSCLKELDDLWNRRRSEQQALMADLQVCQFVTGRPDRFPPGEAQMVCALCDVLASPRRRAELGASRLPSAKELHKLIDRYRAMQNTALNKKEERLFEHIVDRLTEACKWQRDNMQ